jgi:microcystin-dependent protein
MATITGLTAARMKEIEDASVVDGDVVGGNLILTRHDGTPIDAGSVIGPTGPQGPPGLPGMPGEVKLWPGDTLPEFGTYGTWVWADGAVYLVADHPLAASHIAAQWRTFDGKADPGVASFRVPDLRGLVAAGLDAMPGGARSNRMTRAAAIVLAAKTGEELHYLELAEMKSHSHGGSVSVGGGINGTATSAGGHQHSSSSGLGMAVTNQNRNLRTDGSSAYSIITAAELTNVAGAHTHPVSGSFSGSGTISPDGGNGAHENVQPTVFVPYIVCLDN